MTKRSLFRFVALVVAAAASGASVASAAEEETAFTGFVADAACASDYARASDDHQACAIGCVKRGEKVALAMESGFHLLDLTAEEAAEHLGLEVTVTGTLEAASNTIAVRSIVVRTR